MASKRKHKQVTPKPGSEKKNFQVPLQASPPSPRLSGWAKLAGVAISAFFGFFSFVSLKTIIGTLITGSICTGRARCHAENFATAPGKVALHFAIEVFFCLVLGALAVSGIYSMFKNDGDEPH